MPLIVAIEPDGRQAAQLVKLARGSLNAKLVIAESAAQALVAFDEGVPDLILTSPRLSKKDEKALADRLKTLDAAAAHVQRLTIPLLGAAGPARGKSHISRTRRSTDSLIEGCDPEVFAQRIAEYLELAAAERALLDTGTRAADARITPAVDVRQTIDRPPNAEPDRPSFEVEPAPTAPSIGRMLDEILSAARPPSAPAKARAKPETAEVTEAIPPIAATTDATVDSRRDMDLTAFVEEVPGQDAAAPAAVEPVDPAHSLESLAIELESLAIEPVAESAGDALRPPAETLGALFASATTIPLEEATSIDAGEAPSVELGDISSIDLATYVHQLEATEHVESGVIELVADTTIDRLAAESAAEPAAAAPRAEVFEVGEFDVSQIVRFGDRDPVDSTEAPVEQLAIPLATDSISAESAAPRDPAVETFEIGEFDPSLLAGFCEPVTAEIAAIEELTVLLSAALEYPESATRFQPGVEVTAALDEPALTEPPVAELAVVEPSVAERSVHWVTAAPLVPELTSAASDPPSAPADQPTVLYAMEAEQVPLEAAVSSKGDLAAIDPVGPVVAAAEQACEPVEPVVLRKAADWAGVATSIAWPTVAQTATALSAPAPIPAEAPASVEATADPLAADAADVVDVPRRGSLLSRLQGWLSGHRSRLRSEGAAHVEPPVERLETGAAEAAVDRQPPQPSPAVDFAPLAHPTALPGAFFFEATPQPLPAEVRSDVPGVAGDVPATAAADACGILEVETPTPPAEILSAREVVPESLEGDTRMSIGLGRADFSPYFDGIESTKDAADLILLEPPAEHEAAAAVDAASEILTAPLLEMTETETTETIETMGSSDPTIVSVVAEAATSVVAETATLVAAPEDTETAPENDPWSALPPEPPRVWPRLEWFVAVREQIPTVYEEIAPVAEGLAPVAEMHAFTTAPLVFESAAILVEPVLVDAIENLEAGIENVESMIGSTEATISNAEVAATAPISETPAPIGAAETAVGEPWAMHSAIEDTDDWVVASPVVLQTWPRLDWFGIDKTAIVSPDSESIPLAVTIAELDVATEPGRATIRKNSRIPAITRKTRPPARPVQDEWGMFDPEQCGIAAVIAKLDVNDTTEAAGRRPRNRRS